MADLSVSVMAHPSRKQFVDLLKQDLWAGTKVVWDRFNDEYDTARRAWKVGLSEGADYHLVIQDDAMPCHDFMREASDALDWAAGVPVSFYLGAGRPYGEIVKPAVERALKTGRSWIAMRGPLWGVGVAVPVSMIEEMLKVMDSDPHVYDERMQNFFHNKGMECWYTIPSLLDHRTIPSLIEHDLPNVVRQAYVWQADAESKADWTSLPLRVGDPNQPFVAINDPMSRLDIEWKCSACDAISGSIPAMAIHVAEDHGALQHLDFLATDLLSAELFGSAYERLPNGLKGNLWVLGQDLRATAGTDAVWLREGYASRSLRRGPQSPILVTNSDCFSYCGARPVVSLDGEECPTDLPIYDHPGVTA